MSDLFDFIQQSICDIHKWENCPKMTFNGQDYDCAAGSAGNAYVVSEYGFERQADLVLFVRTDAFANGVYPKSKQLITYNGLQYRIDRVNQDPLQASIKLVLTSDTRGI